MRIQLTFRLDIIRHRDLADEGAEEAAPQGTYGNPPF